MLMRCPSTAATASVEKPHEDKVTISRDIRHLAHDTLPAVDLVIATPKLLPPWLLDAPAVSTISPDTPSPATTTRRHRRSASNSSRASFPGLRVETSLPYIVSSHHPAAMGDGQQPSDDASSAADRNSAFHTGSPSSYFSYRPLERGTPLSPASASSLLPSPALSAMIDITPLPSPQYIENLSPRRHPSLKHRASRNSSLATQYAPLDQLPSRSNSLISNKSPPRKQKVYTSLVSAAVQIHPEAPDSVQHHGRQRSVSDFVPEALWNIRQRVATFGSSALDLAEPGSASIQQSNSIQSHLHREEHLSARRGLVKNADPTSTLPSPPPSNVGTEDDDWPGKPEPGVEYFTTHSDDSSRKRKWRSVKQLGEGTFSKVLLATDERLPENVPYQENNLDPHQLVAVKIIEHGPAGGADEDRIKHSLSREVDILKSVRHPSLVHLVAQEEQSTRTYLVLRYCPGGDLFEFASQRRSSLTAGLVQRMFAELAGAVHYLHQNWIVHRDIKLENVLVNVPADALDPAKMPSPQTYAHPIVILTDLGLSRRILQPPASPLLSTRCGSEDYAAPEILLGQAYDGRSTDGWALGVQLYALMEGRLPFDAPPGRPDRSRNTHRIARCDWIWCRFGNESGEWRISTPKSDEGVAIADKSIGEWEGARYCVEGLLKKVRMGRKKLADIVETDWVKQGLQVPGGLLSNDIQSSSM